MIAQSFARHIKLRIGRIKREGRTIRQLITVGALVTAIGGTLSAKILLGWDWQIAVLFGILIIMTGPTVINPLLRKIIHTCLVHIRKMEQFEKWLEKSIFKQDIKKDDN